MVMFDRELNKHTIDSVDKFIEIEFSRADKNGLECFIQVAEEPGFKMIVGIKIGESQTAWVVYKTPFMLKINCILI